VLKLSAEKKVEAKTFIKSEVELKEPNLKESSRTKLLPANIPESLEVSSPSDNHANPNHADIVKTQQIQPNSKPENIDDVGNAKDLKDVKDVKIATIMSDSKARLAAEIININKIEKKS